MIRNDLSLWPLVLSVSRGAPTLEDLRAFSADWDGWLDRGARFATLRVYADAAAHTHPEGGAKEKKRWFQAQGERVASLVVGMATVVPADILETVERMKTEKLFGVPARSFAQVGPAVAWTGARLEEQGLTLDPVRASETLRRLMVE
jgi:hypothetical protein